jgi:uncharacterized protein YecE (DUF72 family)
MSDPLMIGTRGWNHAIGGDFYPAELPDDWRFCYYSNNLRSVLVPQETWDAVQTADIAQWLQDSDPAFRFVIELPATLGLPLTQARREQVLERFLETLEPIAPRTAGLLLRIAPDTDVLPDWFEHFLNRLVDIAPVCVDLPEGPWRAPAVLAVLERQGAGLAWHCARETAPHPGGRLMVALAPPAPAREVRRFIERLAQWQGQDGLDRKTAPAFPALPPSMAVAGLFFDAGAAKAALEARLIAELMGV